MRTETEEKKVKAKEGRPLADIDWKMVDDLLISGCSGREVASSIGINPATIYDRCLKDHGIPFSLYSQQKHEKGESLLRARQFAKAMGYTDKGDNTLLVWLGKTRLKQKEHTDEVITREVESKFEALMKQMKETQERSMDEINISAESKS